MSNLYYFHIQNNEEFKRKTSSNDILILGINQFFLTENNI